MVRARASASVASRDAPVRVASLGGCAGQLGERLRLVGRVGDGAGQGLGVGGQPGRPVRVAGLGGCAGQLGERLRLGVRVGGDGAGQGLGVGGQPVRSVRVAGLGGCAGQLGERLHLVAGVGDGAGQGLGMIDTTELFPHRGQAVRDGLVADGYCVPVDRQLHQSLQVRHVLIRDEALRSPDLGQSGVVASGSPQQERMPAGVAGQRRQPVGVAGGGEQAQVTPDGIARRAIGPAAAGVGADPVVDPLPVAGQLGTELVLGGDPQGLMREQVHSRPGIGVGVAGIRGRAGLQAAAEHPAQDGVQLQRRGPGQSRQVTPGQAAARGGDVADHVDPGLITGEQIPQLLLGAQRQVLGHPRHRQATGDAGAQRVTGRHIIRQAGIRTAGHGDPDPGRRAAGKQRGDTGPSPDRSRAGVVLIQPVHHHDKPPRPFSGLSCSRGQQAQPRADPRPRHRRRSRRWLGPGQ